MEPLTLRRRSAQPGSRAATLNDLIISAAGEIVSFKVTSSVSYLSDSPEMPFSTENSVLVLIKLGTVTIKMGLAALHGRTIPIFCEGSKGLT